MSVPRASRTRSFHLAPSFQANRFSIDHGVVRETGTTHQATRWSRGHRVYRESTTLRPATLSSSALCMAGDHARAWLAGMASRQRVRRRRSRRTRRRRPREGAARRGRQGARPREGGARRGRQGARPREGGARRGRQGGRPRGRCRPAGTPRHSVAGMGRPGAFCSRLLWSDLLSTALERPALDCSGASRSRPGRRDRLNGAPRGSRAGRPACSRLLWSDLLWTALERRGARSVPCEASW